MDTDMETFSTGICFNNMLTEEISIANALHGHVFVIT
jgi:hypothetical protein